MSFGHFQCTAIRLRPIRTKLIDLRPAMSVHARITNVMTVPMSEGVSYGMNYRSPGSVKICTVPIGYADGLIRLLSGKIDFAFNDRAVHQVGNICMDQCMFEVDLRSRVSAPTLDPHIGDEVIIAGPHPSVDCSITTMAKRAATIEHEVTIGFFAPYAALLPLGGIMKIEAVPLDELSQQVAACHACGLCEGRTNTVFGEGDPRAGIMLIGEAPGRYEDLQGRPFVGAAGKLLDELLWHAHLRREEVFIANVLKCRPPSNRNPSASEIEACAPFFAYASADNQPVATRNHGQFCHPVHPENRHGGESFARDREANRALFWWRRCITLPQLFMTPHAWKRSWPISNESAALCMIE